MEWWLVVTSAFLAGIMDAMAGGGGLLTVPALLTSYPTLPPALLLGTNKCSSVFGTLCAAWRYSHRVRLDWRWLAPAALFTFVGAGLGAWTLTWMDPHFLRKCLPWVLLLVLAYTLRHPQFGVQQRALPHRARTRLGLALVMGAIIGWYDGFFGPGTGSFFMFVLVRWLGQDFLHASATAKVLNATSNLAALLLLAAGGHVWWPLGMVMALANVAGSLIGTTLALRHGAGLVRKVFMLVVVILIIKTGIDAYGGTT